MRRTANLRQFSKNKGAALGMSLRAATWQRTGQEFCADSTSLQEHNSRDEWATRSNRDDNDTTVVDDREANPGDDDCDSTISV